MSDEHARGCAIELGFNTCTCSVGRTVPMDDWLKAAAEAADKYPGPFPYATFPPEITVRKIGGVSLVSQQLLCDAGQCDHDHIKDPKPKVRWRTRLEIWWWNHKPHMHLGPCPREEDTW